MSNTSDAQLFEDHFRVTEVDQSKYDRVARIKCTSGDGATQMELDINTELFPCQVGENLHVVLATTLSLDGSKDDERGWRDVAKAGGGEATLADMFDYVCHGKIYKFEDDEKAEQLLVLPRCLTLLVAFTNAGCFAEMSTHLSAVS